MMKFRLDKDEKLSLIVLSVMGFISLSPWLAVCLGNIEQLINNDLFFAFAGFSVVLIPFSICTILYIFSEHKKRENGFEKWVKTWGESYFGKLTFPLIFIDSYETLEINYKCDYYFDLCDKVFENDNYENSSFLYILDYKVKPALTELYKKASCNSEAIEIYKSLASEMLLLYNSLNNVVKKIIITENPHIRKKYEDHLKSRADDIMEYIENLSSKFDDIYLYEQDKIKAEDELEYKELSDDVIVIEDLEQLKVENELNEDKKGRLLEE